MLEGCVRWPDKFIKEYREKGYWEGIPLAEMMSQSIAAFSKKEALVYEDLRITYEEIGIKVTRLALHFLELGLRPRDRLVFQLPNIPELVYTFLGLTKIGVIPITALSPHRESEISYFLEQSGAVGYAIPSEYRRFDYMNMAKKLKSNNEKLKYILVAGEQVEEGMISLNELLDDPIEERYPIDYLWKYYPDPYEVALMLLSGGTTALPKLIPRTHNDYVYNTKQSAKIAGCNEDTVYLAVLPMAHNYTLASSGILGTWAYGGKVVIAPSIDPDTVFSLVEKEKVTIIAAAVPLIAQWVNFPGVSKYDTSSLKVIQNGGARLAPELRQRLMDLFGCTFQEVFGTAEGLLNYTRLDDPKEMILTSSGRPISPGDEVKVVDDAGQELPPGEVGELLCRGPYTVRGYYNAPDHNKKAFTEDGFYHTGDLVRMNKEGFLFTEGRKKDVINRGGEKVNAEEVENLVLSNPKVQNVAMVAMPDPVFGEKGCAYVIFKPGQTMDFKELQEFLMSKNIAKFKLPERLEVVEAFPLSPAGKILKRDLRADIEAKLTAEQNKKSI